MAFLRERSGAWSTVKVAAFTGTLLPAVWFVYRILADDLGPRPVTEAIHFTGDWTVRLLWITLAITPAARIFKQPAWLLPRRILGVAAFAYIFAHFSLYVVDQKFALATVASEIALRFYLTIGFVALSGLAVLAATSTDGMIRRLGPRWITLHRAVYFIAVLAAIHFLLQTRNDVTEPIIMVGLLLWLFGYRLMQRRWRNPLPLQLAALALAAGALTGPIEALWYHFRSNVPLARIFLANFDFSYVIRPMWWVTAAGLAVAMAAAAWQRRPQRTTPRRTAARPASGATQAQSAS